MGTRTAMLMRLIHLLLVAAAIGMQAATDEAYLDSMIDDPSHDVGASDGRRGGPGSLTTSGSFMMAANRAGNDEEEFGEADEDPPTPQADLAQLLASNSLSVGEALDADADADVGGRRRRKDSRRRRKSKGSRRRRKSKFSRRRRRFKSKFIRKALSTPVMLASCKKSWPFQIPGKDKTVHACVKCKPDAPLPFVIGKHGKRLIWVCDATRFKNKMKNKKFLCRKSLSWLDPPNKKANQDTTETGMSAKGTCSGLKRLIGMNNKAAKLYSKHSQDLKLSTTAKLTSESVYANFVKSWVLKPKSDLSLDLARTTVRVEKTVHVAYKWSTLSQVFTVLSHIVRACGYIPEQPLKCLDAKRSQCVWSYVYSNAGKFKSGQNLPGKINPNKKYQDQPCGPNSLLALSTSQKL